MEGFNEAQRPSQNLMSTFYTSIDPYFRLIRGDLGFLDYTDDEVEPYILPRLGQCYSEQCEDEDISLYDIVLPITRAIRASAFTGSQRQLLPFFDRILQP